MHAELHRRFKSVLECPRAFFYPVTPELLIATIESYWAGFEAGAFGELQSYWRFNAWLATRLGVPPNHAWRVFLRRDWEKRGLTMEEAVADFRLLMHEFSGEDEAGMDA